jgi:hypothetical protein
MARKKVPSTDSLLRAPAYLFGQLQLTLFSLFHDDTPPFEPTRPYSTRQPKLTEQQQAEYSLDLFSIFPVYYLSLLGRKERKGKITLDNWNNRSHSPIACRDLIRPSIYSG